MLYLLAKPRHTGIKNQDSGHTNRWRRAALFLAIVWSPTLAIQASPTGSGHRSPKGLHKASETTTAVNTNSHFCRCQDSGESFDLIRVDISQGQKMETKIRSYSKEDFTIIQCEGFVASHPSCH